MEAASKSVSPLIENKSGEDGEKAVADDHDRSCCAAGKNCWQKLREMLWSRRYLVLALTGGQFLALMLAGTGVSSQKLEADFAIAVPTTQLFVNYLLLGLVFGFLLACRKDVLPVLKENWWKYLILGILDVEANYMIVLAYKYTTLTSVQLLDSFTIVCVMILSFVFLRVRYRIIHMMGVALCLIGILSLVIADIRGPRNTPGSIPWLGDMFCIIGAVLYGISNVAQEYLVKNHTIIEYLGLLGIVGAIVSGIQLSIFERVDVASIDFLKTPEIGVHSPKHQLVGRGLTSALLGGILFGVFWCSMFLFYSVMAVVMRLTNAVVVNLSLLTADFYTLLFGIVLFKYHFTIFYLMAFTLIITGVFIFNLKAPAVAKRKETTPRQKRLLTFSWRRKKSKEASSAALQSKAEEGNEREGILGGPHEPVLSSNSYSTSYSQSMSYSSKPKSYGSQSTEGSEFLRRWSSGELNIDKNKNSPERNENH